MESQQPGDACIECLNQGLNHKLRYFYLNLEEQLLKCESRTCLWPHNDAVSSDEEDFIAEPIHATTVEVVEDDDEFIKQLLEQLGPCSNSATDLAETQLNPESSSNASTSAPANIDDIIALSDLFTTTQQVPSPKRMLAQTVTDLQQCDKRSPVAATTPTTTYSLPDLLSEPSVSPILRKPANDHTETQPVKLEETRAPGGIDPIISYTISFPQQVVQQPIPKRAKTNDIPKVKLFQLAPKKAYTIARKKQDQQQAEAEAEPTSMPSAVTALSTQTSSFLEALKRPAAPPMRGGRRHTRSRRDNVGGVRFLSGGVQALKQKLERLEAQSRQRDNKAESEPGT